MTMDLVDRLPEHECNPLMKGLGLPRNLEQHFGIIRRSVAFNPEERRMQPHLRRYCVLRLFQWVEPLNRQIDLAERIEMAICQSYKGRNPAIGAYQEALFTAVERVEKKNLVVSAMVASTAVSFAVLGHPGMGKTTTLQGILASIPQVLRPELDFTVVQVVWLFVECPHKGSERQLCLAILTALDRCIGTRYYHAHRRLPSEELMLHVQHLLQLHAVGVLVVDESQNLRQSKAGPEPMMNFLVSLRNMTGVSVIVAGTMSAATVIHSDFHGARRGVGLGAPNWERLLRGEEWTDFLAELWRHQWTRQHSELSPEIEAVLYHESQGIIDILIGLFVLSQITAIHREEATGQPCPLTAELVAKVAADEFKIVRPMMEALRSDAPNALDRYPDLTGMHRHLEKSLCHRTGLDLKNLRERQRNGDAAATAVEDADPQDALLRRALKERGLGQDVVEDVLKEARKLLPKGDLLETLQLVSELTGQKRDGTPAKPKGPTAKERLAARDANRKSGDILDAVECLPEEGDAYTALVNAGHIVHPDAIAAET